MLKNPLQLGIMLFGITMLIFFVVYYFFSGVNYYESSLTANAFILPALYAITAFLSVRYFWKNNDKVSFKDAFRRAFIPMFTGGLLSLFSIFMFLNFVDSDAKDLLNYQFVERNKKELTEVYEKEKAALKTDKDKEELERDYQKSLQSFDKEQVKDTNMFTFRYFSIYFGAIFIFYLVLSLFFGAFFRTKSPIQEPV